ncbi:MAG: hypothetical protein M3Y33_00550 [Actinomycetota bacterium]|nr:hypothetical protein [Actinomycetota bacterium]
MTANDAAIRLGQAVEYRDSKGRSKAAFVTGTPATCAEGVLSLEENEAHLFVVSPAGSAYFRRHVLRHDADEPLVGSGSWRPVP